MNTIKIRANNNDYFSKEIKDYKVSYLRTDEVYLFEKYVQVGMRILVIGCGTGRVLGPLKRMYGTQNIIAGDLNEDMVREAKANHPELYIEKMDATNLPFLPPIDVVFFPFHGIDCVYPDIYNAVSEIARVLYPNGIFIMSSHNRFYLKKLHRFFEGAYADDHGLLLYRTTWLDKLYLKKYFRKVTIIQRINIAISWKDANWKDIIYKLLPFFNKSTYFICQK